MRQRVQNSIKQMLRSWGSRCPITDDYFEQHLADGRCLIGEFRRRVGVTITVTVESPIADGAFIDADVFDPFLVFSRRAQGRLCCRKMALHRGYRPSAFSDAAGRIYRRAISGYQGLLIRLLPAWAR